MYALLTLYLLEVTPRFFSLRTLSCIVSVVNYFKPTYICILNNQSKKPPVGIISPHFEQRWQQFGSKNKLICETKKCKGILFSKEAF